ncbi:MULTISPECIES: hypothetical protein [Chryseobacterium]|uniref:hypothetical protein n=1 Tax=Chryseobacterium TaxID=59732 RepID=UPI00195D5636|nr:MULTISPECIES: hypothetical protein [Chryseobacterium]MBM7421649.1 hypothetical protein [Chryseobacterium sp. JUb44]MDH6211617.1 hypothetical protein [Chryseobacterium sp. BIGb0186]WSO10259.1 hypothetical protein VUJ64_20945 [Chryseobacterium scophthalmum]
MKSKSILAASFFSVAFLLTSCGQKDQNVEMGKEFKVYENPITILKLEESKVLRNDKDSTLLIAPNGKKYVYFEVKNPKNEMIFLKAFNKDAEVKSDDDVNLAYYSHDIDNGFDDEFFLIDDNSSIDKVVITNPSEEQFVLMNPKITKSSNVISPEAQKIVESFSKEINLLNAFAPYVKDGKDVMTITKNEGDLPVNRMSMKAEVDYFSKDGNFYIFKTTDIFKNIAKVYTTWENGKITSLVVKPHYK